MAAVKRWCCVSLRASCSKSTVLHKTYLWLKSEDAKVQQACLHAANKHVFMPLASVHVKEVGPLCHSNLNSAVQCSQ